MASLLLLRQGRPGALTTLLREARGLAGAARRPAENGKADKGPPAARKQSAPRNVADAEPGASQRPSHTSPPAQPSLPPVKPGRTLAGPSPSSGGQATEGRALKTPSRKTVVACPQKAPPLLRRQGVGAAPQGRGAAPSSPSSSSSSDSDSDEEAAGPELSPSVRSKGLSRVPQRPSTGISAGKEPPTSLGRTEIKRAGPEAGRQASGRARHATGELPSHQSKDRLAAGAGSPKPTVATEPGPVARPGSPVPAPSARGTPVGPQPQLSCGHEGGQPEKPGPESHGKPASPLTRKERLEKPTLGRVLSTQEQAPEGRDPGGPAEKATWREQVMPGRWAEDEPADPMASQEQQDHTQEPTPAPPASPEPFDNTRYRNLQHHDYTAYTFLDLNLDLAKLRLPQPSSGRPSPRH